jgi:acyl-CoA oxidase
VKGEDHGPHIFVVPIRRLDDHRIMPHVTIGEVGSKMGRNGVDSKFDFDFNERTF